MDRCHLVILILCGIASSQAEQIIANQMFNHPNSTQVDYARRYEPKRCSFYNCFNGFCYYGLCVCGRGWAGNMCSQCIPRRDCIKGFCYVPGGCECEFGYYGSNCDHQDLGLIGDVQSPEFMSEWDEDSQEESQLL